MWSRFPPKHSDIISVYHILHEIVIIELLETTTLWIIGSIPVREKESDTYAEGSVCD